MELFWPKKSAAIGAQVFDGDLRPPPVGRNGWVVTCASTITEHSSSAHCLWRLSGAHRSSTGAPLDMTVLPWASSSGADTVTAILVVTVAFVIRFLDLGGVRLHQVGGGVRLEILHDTLGAQRCGQNHRQRQKHVEGGAREVHPEIARVLEEARFNPRMTARRTAMPVAALRKLCTANPPSGSGSSWWFRPSRPASWCWWMKLMAVFSASAQGRCRTVAD